jgi:hypothetical protein
VNHPLLGAGVVPNVLDSLLAKVWKSWSPYEGIVFSWQLLQDRMPTRQNLGDDFCAFCGISIEAVDHLLVTCVSISLVWNSIFR